MMPYLDHKVVRIESGLSGGLTGKGCASGFSEVSAPSFCKASGGALSEIPYRRSFVRPGKQRGVVLFIALIALVALTLAGIALMRSVDTGNVIAGNLAFKQATLQASDLGTEAALSALTNIINTHLDADCWACAADTTGVYYATMRWVNPTTGVLTTAADAYPPPLGTPIDWTTVPTVPTTAVDYKVQYVIDRLCHGPPIPVTDIPGQCISSVPLGGGTFTANGIVFASATAVYYRVTVRVTGPRNTVSMVQTMLSHN